MIDTVEGIPLVIKLLEGTQGKGVVLAETKKAASSVLSAFRQLKANILVQEFIKEADVPMDMQMELPDAPDYLGDDGRDYEGSKARSQMLKMKRYIIALGQMIDDETELEAWVQAKLTKASDYMSSVYHYLDYQRSRMEEK